MDGVCRHMYICIYIYEGRRSAAVSSIFYPPKKTTLFLTIFVGTKGKQGTFHEHHRVVCCIDRRDSVVSFHPRMEDGNLPQRRSLYHVIMSLQTQMSTRRSKGRKKYANNTRRASPKRMLADHYHDCGQLLRPISISPLICVVSKRAAEGVITSALVFQFEGRSSAV